VTDELDLEQRELCPDGACIGVLGPEGRCNECGRTRAQAEAGVEVDAAVEATPPGESFDDDRELCPDGACTGIIGADGRCKECGRARDAQ